MLTPAELLGLSGLALASRVSKAFYGFSDTELVEMSARVREESLRRSLIYMRGGQAEPIPILLRPITVLPDQLVYLRSVSLTILNALKRLPDLYLRDASVREALRLPPEEER